MPTGTGKTATLKELRRGLSEGERDIIAIAPTMSAVAELKSVGFTEAMSVERLLQDSRTQSGLGDTVTIADEAGMLSGRQLAELLGLTQRSGARIVFTGDTRQIQSVEAGDAMRVLETESRLKSVSAGGAAPDGPLLTNGNRGPASGSRERLPQLNRSARSERSVGGIVQPPWRKRGVVAGRAWPFCPGRLQDSDEIDRGTDAIRAAVPSGTTGGRSSAHTRRGHWLDSRTES